MTSISGSGGIVNVGFTCYANSVIQAFRNYPKIETLFKFAIYNGNTNLVLGALGCGVFQNPPNEIIEIFNKCIKKYNGYFSNIIFSVKNLPLDE